MERNNREYSNGEITVFWRPKECIHATVCYTKLRAVFDPRKRPWVNIHAAPTDEIIEIIKKCPTDALTYKWNDDTKKANYEKDTNSEKNPSLEPVKINLMKDGPIVIDGDFKIIDEDDKEFKSMKMASLCRCGVSNAMPYCDGTHRKIGFSTNEDKV